MPIATIGVFDKFIQKRKPFSRRVFFCTRDIRYFRKVYNYHDVQKSLGIVNADSDLLINFGNARIRELVLTLIQTGTAK